VPFKTRGATGSAGRPSRARGLGDAKNKILADATLRLSDAFGVLLAQLGLELDQLTARIEQMDAVIHHLVTENEAYRRLTAIPGVGPVTARSGGVGRVPESQEYRTFRQVGLV